MAIAASVRPSVPSLGATVALVLLAASPAPAQLVGGRLLTRHHWEGQAANQQLGFAVANLGDVDGDGAADLAVSAPFASPAGRISAGSVSILSGATGLTIRRHHGASVADLLGYSAGGGGDVNGDGVPDVILGAPEADPGGVGEAGSALVFSGATGVLLHRFDGADLFEYLGAAVDLAGDVDGDGFADLIVGAPLRWANGVRESGSAFVFSGATGAVLWRFDGSEPIDELGGAVAGAGDVNGDGVPDLIAGAANADPNGLDSAGSAFVYSGADGSLLWRFDGPGTGAQLGTSVAGAGDVNGDGFADLIVGAPYASVAGVGSAGSAFVYSGADGSLLRRFDGSAVAQFSGAAVAGVGDGDGDGLPDVLVGSPGLAPGGGAMVLSPASGALLHLFQGSAAGDQLGKAVSGADRSAGAKTSRYLVGAPTSDTPVAFRGGNAYLYEMEPFLFTSASTCSIAQGAQIDIGLSFPESVGGDQYLILLSGTGKGPVVLKGLLVPLSPDGIFSKSLNRRFPRFAIGFWGRLDASGRAGALIEAAPGELWPGLANRTIYMAAVNAGADFASVARSLTILP